MLLSFQLVTRNLQLVTRNSCFTISCQGLTFTCQAGKFVQLRNIARTHRDVISNNSCQEDEIFLCDSLNTLYYNIMKLHTDVSGES